MDGLSLKETGAGTLPGCHSCRILFQEGAYLAPEAKTVPEMIHKMPQIRQNAVSRDTPRWLARISRILTVARAITGHFS
jgi:hypothetical protein